MNLSSCIFLNFCGAFFCVYAKEESDTKQRTWKKISSPCAISNESYLNAWLSSMFCFFFFFFKRDFLFVKGKNIQKGILFIIFFSKGNQKRKIDLRWASSFRVRPSRICWTSKTFHCQDKENNQKKKKLKGKERKVGIQLSDR